MALGMPDNLPGVQMPRGSLNDIAKQLASSLPYLLSPSHPLPELSEAEEIDGFEWWTNEAKKKVQNVWGSSKLSLRKQLCIRHWRLGDLDKDQQEKGKILVR